MAINNRKTNRNKFISHLTVTYSVVVNEPNPVKSISRPYLQSRNIDIQYARDVS